MSCKRIMKHDMRNVGVTHTSQCTKPVYKDELCAKHYKASQAKLIPWGERENYEPLTLEAMNRGSHFKRSDSYIHKLLRLKNGVIQEFSKDTWTDTLLEVNHTLYCKKTY